MSKVLFLNIPAHGHTNPTLPVVKELVERGEQVIYYSSDSFKDKIERTGAVFRSYVSGVQFDGHEIDKNIFVNAGMAMEATREILPGVLEDLRERGDDKPDYIIHDSMCVWGKYAAKILDVPAACSVTMFAFGTRPALHSWTFIRSLVRMWIDGFSGTARWFRAARAINKRFDVNTFLLKDVFTNREKLNIVYTSRLFQPGEGSFSERRFKFVGPSIAPRNETFDLPVNKNEKRKIVYVSLGTIVSDLPTFYPACFEAFGTEDVVVIMSVGNQTDVASLGEIPDNFIVRNRVPQLEVLKRASAFLTHAGMNSVSEGLRECVPLLCFPQTAEQGMVAKRVEQCGAGLRIHHKDITPENLRAAIRTILDDDSYGRGAERIAKSFEAGGGYVRAADEIFAFKKAMGIR